MSTVSILRLEGNSFVIDEESFTEVLKKVGDLPVILISMNGTKREGKSYMLSNFIQYFQSNGHIFWSDPPKESQAGFIWKKGTERETVGINLWSEPFVIPHPSGEKGKEAAVLLLDCQGLFDDQTTNEQNVAIYALSALFSSVLIYNVMKKVEESLLQNLSFFTSYSRAISPEQPSPEDLPKLALLVRDFENEDEYGLGFHTASDPRGNVDGRECLNYYKFVFEPSEVRGSAIPEGNRETRANILGSYSDPEIFLMPYPGEKFVNYPLKFPPKPRFQQMTQHFIDTTVKTATTKKIGREEMTGEKFIEYIQVVAQLCRQSKTYFPQVESIESATAKLQNYAAVDRACNTFKEECELLLEEYPDGASEEIFESHLPELLNKAFHLYGCIRSLGSLELTKECLEKIENWCQNEFQRYFVPTNNGRRRKWEREEKKKKERRERKKAERERQERAKTRFTRFEEATGAFFRGTLPHSVITEARITPSAAAGFAGASKAVVNTINKVALPVAVAVDVVRLGFSVAKDVQNKSARNTVRTTASVAGGWGGCFGAGAAGAAIGSAIFPGVGTVVGGIVGGIAGGIGLSLGASAAVDAIGDATNFDMETRDCEECGNPFTVRKYKGEGVFIHCLGCR